MIGKFKLWKRKIKSKVFYNYYIYQEFSKVEAITKIKKSNNNLI
jgi:hypothetical protein